MSVEACETVLDLARRIKLPRLVVQQLFDEATQQKLVQAHGRFEQHWLVHPISLHRESPPIRSGSRPATDLDSVVETALGCAMPNPNTLPFAMATFIQPLQAMYFHPNSTAQQFDAVC
jgi:hypothetical protein